MLTSVPGYMSPNSIAPGGRQSLRPVLHQPPGEGNPQMPVPVPMSSTLCTLFSSIGARKCFSPTVLIITICVKSSRTSSRCKRCQETGFSKRRGEYGSVVTYVVVWHDVLCAALVVSIVGGGKSRGGTYGPVGKRGSGGRARSGSRGRCWSATRCTTTWEAISPSVVASVEQARRTPYRRRRPHPQRRSPTKHQFSRPKARPSGSH